VIDDDDVAIDDDDVAMDDDDVAIDDDDVAIPTPPWMTTPVGAGPRACPPYDDDPGRHDPYDVIVITRSSRRVRW